MEERLSREKTLSLQPYLDSLLHRWWIVAIIALLSGISSGIFTIRQTIPHTARSSIVLIPTSYRSPFYTDQKIEYQYLPITVNQYAVLMELARSDILEKRVATTLNIEHRSGELLGRINLTTNGDYIQITTQAESSAEAEQLATAWAKEYVQLVVETYSQYRIAQMFIEQQLQTATEQYRAAQAALEAFVAEGDMIIAEQELERLQRLVSDAQAATNQTITPSTENKQIIDELIVVRTRYEQLVSRQQELLRDRDAAAALIAGLHQKSNQLRIDETTPPVLAKYLSTVVYTTPSVDRQKMARATIMALIGAIIGAFAIVIGEALVQFRRRTTT